MAAKRAVLSLAKANTTNVEGIDETRALMEPHLKVLGDYFASLKSRGEMTDAKEQELTGSEHEILLSEEKRF